MEYIVPTKILKDEEMHKVFFMLFPRYSPKRTLLYQFHLLEIEDREIRILKIKDYEPSLTLVENVAKDFDVSKKDVTELLEQLKKPHCET